MDDNNNDNGLELSIWPFLGTNFTQGSSVDTWETYAAYTGRPDMTSTWWTTNDAEFEYTGVQLEIGSIATPYKHQSPNEELRECQRYYFTSPENGISYLPGEGSPGRSRICMYWPTEMRAAPTVTATNWTMAGMTTGVVGYRSDGSIDTLPAIVADSEL